MDPLHQGRIWEGGFNPHPPSKSYAYLNYLYNILIRLEHHSFEH